MELEEIIKMIIFVVVLAIMVGGAVFLFSGKGGEILGSIGDMLRFGR